jgi:hypothetical protein
LPRFIPGPVPSFLGTPPVGQFGQVGFAGAGALWANAGLDAANSITAVANVRMVRFMVCVYLRLEEAQSAGQLANR